MGKICVQNQRGQGASSLKLAQPQTNQKPIQNPIASRPFPQVVCALLLLFAVAPQLHAQYFPNSTAKPATPPVKPISPDGKEAPQVTTTSTNGAKAIKGDKSAVLAETEFACSDAQRPPIWNPASNKRRAIEGDYVVIEYDAQHFQTRWYDYHQWYHFKTEDWKNINPIDRNGTFLPVVYAKEKVAVHVCGLKFTDMLTVTNNSTGLPEGGADIRGGAIVTAVPTLAPALDSLQTVGTTGGTISIGGLGFGATGVLSSMAVTGIAPGTISRNPSGVTYADANITASPEQLALMMYAVKRNGVDLSDSIANDIDKDWPIPGVFDHFTKYPPNHIEHVMAEAEQRLNDVKDDRKLDGSISDTPRFDKDMANTQAFANELTNFFAAISSQGFGARAVVLQNNYAILRGPLDLIERGEATHDCIAKTKGQDARDEAQQAAIDSARANLDLDEAKLKHPSDTKLIAALTEKSKQAVELAAQTLSAAEGQKDSVTYETASKLNCDPWETANFKTFVDQYNKKLQDLIDSDSDLLRRARVSRWTPAQMFLALNGLREHIDKVADKTGDLFNEINDWNESSSVEQTDFITPTSANAIERISIVVQHGYIPFNLTTYATSTAPTATAPAAVTTTTAATTSTPAHAVKTILIEVHRRANFNLIGGAMAIRVPTSTYTVQAGNSPAVLTTSVSIGTPTISTVTTTTGTPPSTTTTTSTTVTNTYTFTYAGMCNNTSGTIATYTASSTATSVNAVPPTPPSPPNPPNAPGYSCIVQTQTGNSQLAGMIGMDWFPLGRDYFPRRNGFSIYPRDLIPSAFAATSVTTLGNAAFGLNVEPVNGLNFLFGRGMAHTTVLPSGVTTSSVLPSGFTLPSVTQVKWGWTYGIGLDLSVFTQIFTKGTSAALP